MGEFDGGPVRYPQLLDTVSNFPSHKLFDGPLRLSGPKDERSNQAGPVHIPAVYFPLGYNTKFFLCTKFAPQWAEVGKS